MENVPFVTPELRYVVVLLREELLAYDTIRAVVRLHHLAGYSGEIAHRERLHGPARLLSPLTPYLLCILLVIHQDQVGVVEILRVSHLHYEALGVARDPA